MDRGPLRSYQNRRRGSRSGRAQPRNEVEPQTVSTQTKLIRGPSPDGYGPTAISTRSAHVTLAGVAPIQTSATDRSMPARPGSSTCWRMSAPGRSNTSTTSATAGSTQSASSASLSRPGIVYLRLIEAAGHRPPEDVGGPGHTATSSMRLPNPTPPGACREAAMDRGPLRSYQNRRRGSRSGRAQPRNEVEPQTVSTQTKLIRGLRRTDTFILNRSTDFFRQSEDLSALRTGLRGRPGIRRSESLHLCHPQRQTVTGMAIAAELG